MLDEYLVSAAARPFNAFDEELPREFIVFGTGERGQRCGRRLAAMGIQVVCFADNDQRKQGTTIDGLPVTAPADVARIWPNIPVIICSWAEKSIFSQLFRLGFREIYRDNLSSRPPIALLAEHAADVDKVLASLADEESRNTYADVLKSRFYGSAFYFYSNYPVYAHPQVLAEKGDVVIDGGAASGDTVLYFAKQGCFDCTIYSFEPTPKSFEDMIGYLATLNLKNVHPVNKALWNKNETVTFFEAYETSLANKISDKGGISVQAVTLDSFVKENDLGKVDLIKLDIEGAELAALEGARETLRRFKPKLQICLYHKDADLWELPLFLKDLVPEYQLYIGHHTCTNLDTVLYCRT